MQFVNVTKTHLGKKHSAFTYATTEAQLRHLFRRIAQVQADVANEAGAANVNRPAEAYALSRIYALKIIRVRVSNRERREALMTWAAQYLTDKELENVGY